MSQPEYKPDNIKQNIEFIVLYTYSPLKGTLERLNEDLGSSTTLQKMPIADVDFKDIEGRKYAIRLALLQLGEISGNMNRYNLG